jgi:hypothetical protein
VWLQEATPVADPEWLQEATPVADPEWLWQRFAMPRMAWGIGRIT